MSPTPRNIEDLANFPYSSLSDLTSRIQNKNITIQANRYMAMEFFAQSHHVGSTDKLVSMILGVMPYIVALSVVIYTLLSKTWLALLTLPIMCIEIMVFNPRNLRLLPWLKIMLQVIVIIVLNLSIFFGIPWLICVCVSLIVIWFANKLFFAIIVNETIRVALDNEDVFCLLWSYKVLSLESANGDFINADGSYNLKELLEDSSEIN